MSRSADEKAVERMLSSASGRRRLATMIDRWCTGHALDAYGERLVVIATITLSRPSRQPITSTKSRLKKQD